MGTMLRQTRAPELGWLASPHALRLDYEEGEQQGEDAIDAMEGKAPKPQVHVRPSHLLPEQIDRSVAQLERVVRMRLAQRIVVVGWSVRVHMSVLAKDTHVSRRTARRALHGACDVLAREGFG